MIKIKRTNSEDPDFIELVRHLDEYIAKMDGAEHVFYAQFNKIDTIRHVVVAYDGDIPVSCGAMKQFSTDTMEIKRMFTLPEYRGKGIAGMVLAELERWAGEINYKRCILETGRKFTSAVSLYTGKGYRSIVNYGQYAGVINSVCFEKWFGLPEGS